MQLYYVNGTGGQSTIRLPAEVVDKFGLKPGRIRNPAGLSFMLSRAGFDDLARFIHYARQQGAWVGIRTEQQHNEDIIGRYT